MYGTGRGKGGLIREGAGPITAEITVRAGQGGQQAGATAHGARQAREGGRGQNLGTGSRVCETIPGSLRMGQCRLDSAPITSVTAERGGWSRHYGGCHRPTWTWESSRRRKSQMVSTPVGRPDTASS